MMPTVSLAVICLALFATVASGQKVKNCATANFASLDKCCKSPIGDLATAELMQVCSGDAKLYPWVNDYMLNKIQVVNKANAIDITNPANKKTLCSVATFMNCLFEKTSLLNADGTVSTTAVNDYLNNHRNESDPWKAKLQQHVETLGPLNEYVPPAFSNGINCTDPSASKANKKAIINVSLTPLILIQFLQIGVVDMCPEFVPFNKANKCGDNLDTWRACYTSLMTSLNKNATGPAKQSVRNGNNKMFEYINKQLLAKGKRQH